MSAGLSQARGESLIALGTTAIARVGGQARMSASSRMKIIIPLVSAIPLSRFRRRHRTYCRQDPRPRRACGARRGRAAPEQPEHAQGPPPQQAARPAEQPAASRTRRPGPGPHGAGGPPPGRNYARGPAPERDRGGHAYRGNRAWDGGAGATRSATAAPAGGGTSAASGTIIGSGWPARRPTSPRITSTRCRWPMLRRRLPSPTNRRRLRHRLIPAQTPLAAPSSAACWAA